MVTPICFAVFKLITNSNLIGCCTGRSAGLAPFRILSTYQATGQQSFELIAYFTAILICQFRCANEIESRKHGDFCPFFGSLIGEP